MCFELKSFSFQDRALGIVTSVSSIFFVWQHVFDSLAHSISFSDFGYLRPFRLPTFYIIQRTNQAVEYLRHLSFYFGCSEQMIGRTIFQLQRYGHFASS